MQNIPKLTKRMRAAADHVRADAIVADVGTDHAYLPIALCMEGRARSCVASDINEGPIMRARAHIAEYGLEDRIETVLTDGLDKIERYRPTDVLILGMGGELIADIISRAPFTRDSGIRLILQPMTHPEAVRAFLLSNGYAIVGETVVSEEKIYQIICAEYAGEGSPAKAYSEVELLLGRLNIENKPPHFSELVDRFITVFSERARGKRMAGANTDEEEKMLAQLEELKG